MGRGPTRLRAPRRPTIPQKNMGREGGPPTPLGAPPPTLDPSGGIATSPEGSRPVGEPPIESGPPPIFPRFSIKKTREEGRGPQPGLGLPRRPSIPPARWLDSGHLA
ncbi:hypothetical protein CRG98_004386 [Punica granatum]|uniref:Uncharacterized protein n=1 Tax=Punica granatum TaxID=22663 RepID=A0A2I0L3E6_PUNGR|nr:hypothetical protein CRG98_004386 [Punica granatum]